jgi:cyclophilin family peptidyl-prolyl cis-trans isomerase
MRILAALLAAAAALPAFAASPHHAVIETSIGNVTVELDAKNAPKTVSAFAAYAKAGAYDNTAFHRVVKDFVVQGGEYTLCADNGEPWPVWPSVRVARFAPEEGNGLRNRRATIAMTRGNASRHGMAPNGFFFNLRDNDFLDYRRFESDTPVATPRGPQVVPAGTEIEGYAVFGRVVSGWEVVERIAQVPVTRSRPPHEHLPVTPVLVKRVRLLSAQW